MVRVGIIGVGNIGTAHLRWIAGHPESHMRITALCDTDPDKRDRLREQFPDVRVLEDYHMLLESGLTDAVIIATPHYGHPVIAIEAFRAGQHVLIEKPAGVYTRKVREMNEAARNSSKIFGIMFNQRTNPLFAKARDIVRRGELGEFKRMVWIITNWYRTQAYYDSGSWRATWNGEGGGVLLNQAPHNLDIWQWILGMPDRVFAICKTGRYHHIAVEDDVTIQAEYGNGASATFITTTGEYPGTNRLEISGDMGKLVLENEKLCWWKLSQPERQYCFSAASNDSLPKIAYEEFEQSDTFGHPVILRNFADAIINGEPLIAPGNEGIYSLTLSNAAYLSAWTNSWITLPLDEALFERCLRQRCQREETEDADFSRRGERELDDHYQARWKVQW